MGGGKFCRYQPNELGDDLRTRKKEEGVFGVGRSKIPKGKYPTKRRPTA